tara:strand:+ start:195 stop:1472 length:1278 start_codon:yes stop_codon:yes gene_type:complete
MDATRKGIMSWVIAGHGSTELDTTITHWGPIKKVLVHLKRSTANIKARKGMLATHIYKDGIMEALPTVDDNNFFKVDEDFTIMTIPTAHWSLAADLMKDESPAHLYHTTSKQIIKSIIDKTIRCSVVEHRGKVSKKYIGDIDYVNKPYIFGSNAWMPSIQISNEYSSKKFEGLYGLYNITDEPAININKRTYGYLIHKMNYDRLDDKETLTKRGWSDSQYISRASSASSRRQSGGEIITWTKNTRKIRTTRVDTHATIGRKENTNSTITIQMLMAHLKHTYPNMKHFIYIPTCNILRMTIDNANIPLKLHKGITNTIGYTIAKRVHKMGVLGTRQFYNSAYIKHLEVYTRRVRKICTSQINIQPHTPYFLYKDTELPFDEYEGELSLYSIRARLPYQTRYMSQNGKYSPTRTRLGFEGVVFNIPT